MKKNQKSYRNNNLISLYSIPQPHSRITDIKNSKKNFTDSSSHSISNIPSNKHLDNNNFKDSLEGSVTESKTNIFIPDSLNNTKSSLGNIINKINSKKNKLNDSKNNKNISKSFNGENDEKNSGKNNEETTKKIDYRFYTNYPIIINNNSENRKERKENKHWLAVYDKLIKRKNLLKILNYYENEKNKSDKKLNNIYQELIKEKLLIVKDFDIYFMKESNRPFIKYIKGNCIFVKLYLLTIDQINLILNYVNRYKLSFTLDNIRFLYQKGNYQKINDNFKNFPYNIVYHMGNYMNINIYGFSNFNIYDNNYISSYNNLNQKFPSSKKIAKLVKILMINFPNYSFNFFLCYLLSKIRFENFSKKSEEIKNLIYSKHKSLVPLINRYYNNSINNSKMHSTYSPLSNNEDDESSNKPIVKDYNENYYQQIIEKNLPFEFHTIDNDYKCYNNKMKKNNFNKNNNKNYKKKNNSEKKRFSKKHTESVYLNGYLGKENNILFKNNGKIQKNRKTITNENYNKKKIDKIWPSSIIYEYNLDKKNLRKKKNITKNKSINLNNKIKFSNFVRLQKKNNRYLDKGILNNNEIFSLNFETGKDFKLMDEKDKNKTNINQITSKIIINTKSEETKIGTTNKEVINNINNSSKEEINKENTGIFVVNKKMTSNIQDYIEEDSSMIINNNKKDNGQSVYITPEKKKKYRYYS